MSKTTVTWLFVAAIVAVVAGVLIALAALAAALANGAVVIEGSDGVIVNGGPFAAMVVWLVIASLAMAGGGIAALVSWIGALLNTLQLEDKTWFLALLVLGLFSFGWLATAAYVVAGPDSTKLRPAYPDSAMAPSS